MPIWKSLLSRPDAILALILLGAVVLAGVLAPLIFPGGPWRMVARPFIAPFTDMGHPLGTDALGRDLAVALIYGARTSLEIGLVSTCAAVLFGTAIGGIAGFFGGRVDSLLMRSTEMFQTVPSFALAILLVAIYSPSLLSIMAAIAVVSWPPVARLARAEFLSMRRREFVQAALLSGQSNLRVAWSQILPNVLSPLIVMAALMISMAILFESALSFVGLGDPQVVSWGYLISAGRGVMARSWWLTFLPGFSIMLTIVSISILGDAIGDSQDPHFERKETE
ncbi:ABC transporter permease [Antarcticimicrobium luteum]|uniref:ABC transporter permease n=1 Tax=Antarcticimicrobium luteum TaxID=2547397 RepID=A0A4R5V981_9RHOB|nr:ABC transporter permease [Antarcticimicrobium luteum]TDK48683.1 ABC transporter permease [Antarcticimicrobium luteum]